MPDKANVLRSRRAIELALEFGTVVISPVVRVELAVMFGDETGLDLFLADTCIKLVPADSRDLALAGRLWRSYAGRRPRRVGCRRCGESVEMGCARCGSPLGTRRFALTDFLVLSHAARHADWLLARAGGAYRWASGLRSVGLRDLWSVGSPGVGGAPVDACGPPVPAVAGGRGVRSAGGASGAPLGRDSCAAAGVRGPGRGPEIGPGTGPGTGRWAAVALPRKVRRLGGILSVAALAAFVSTAAGARRRRGPPGRPRPPGPRRPARPPPPPRPAARPAPPFTAGCL